MAHRSQEAQLTQAAKWNRDGLLWFLLKPANLNSYAIGIPKSAVNGTPMLVLARTSVHCTRWCGAPAATSEVVTTFAYMPPYVHADPCGQPGRESNWRRTSRAAGARLLFRIGNTHSTTTRPKRCVVRPPTLRRRSGPIRWRWSQRRPPSAPCNILAA